MHRLNLTFLQSVLDISGEAIKASNLVSLVICVKGRGWKTSEVSPD